ncbi:putative disease resistance protein RGA4 [Quercus lobata]|nr:putative disease resistance protein RGA4 [Quercus lobata]XP_030957232.1 putative disease resistance protein RGA4 [Quercus lobata]XP_030957234.1 putative disease resistance protein RGA4 [Quercus lobata]XP_030957235.1 putative disease resistance protein RGA4 [Quercus lobata]XP_030957236.1 putative disease resistance protein RGA4 [Quercus lobata]XP_030957237.1 putative disease resistance protein RGA4 [Quercus lobata]XP_030957238.1 putative disease resistance protein RGA4 [Quercus lobata]XP_0
MLNLSDCIWLKELPENIPKLANLRCLEINGCHSLTHMPPGLGQLTSLQVLPLFIMTQEPEADFFSKYCSGLAELLIVKEKPRANFFAKHCGSLAELNKLNNLRGELCIILNLARVKNAASEAKAANLKDKQHLRRLKLQWDRQKAKKGKDVEDVRNDENLMKGLRPHPNLKNLYVEWYKGVRFPSWLASLTNLVELEISNSKCNHLPPMYQLPCLRDLSLKYMPNLKRIATSSHSFSSYPSPSLSKLKSLYLIEILDLEFLAEQWLQNLASLENLTIEACAGLKYLPLSRSIQHLTSLKSLEIRGCEEVDLFSDDEIRFFSVTSLQTLKISDVLCLITLPVWIGNLTSLQDLEIEGCPNLKSLPEGIGNLSSLQSLIINGQCPLPLERKIPKWRRGLA